MALGAVFPVVGATVVSESLLQRSLRFRELAIIDASSYTCGYLLVGVPSAFLGMGMWSLVLANLVQSLARWTLIRRSVGPALIPRLRLDALRELTTFGAGFSIARVANLVATQGDNIVVGRVLGAGALGLYSRAYQLLMVPANLVGQSIDRVLFPIMAQVQADSERLRKGFLRGTAAVALATFPLSVICVLLADRIVHVLFGPQWLEVGAPFRWFAAILMLRTGYKMSESLSRATGAVYRRAWRQVVYAIAVVVGASIGGRIGLSAVAGFVGAAIALNYLLMTHLSASLLGLSGVSILRAHSTGALVGLGAGVAGGCALLAVDGIIQSPQVVILFVMAAALVGMIVAFRLLPANSRESEVGWLLTLAAPRLPTPVVRVIRALAGLQMGHSAP